MFGSANHRHFYTGGHLMDTRDYDEAWANPPATINWFALAGVAALCALFWLTVLQAFC